MFAITTAAALVFVAQAAPIVKGYTLAVEARDLITDAAVPDVSVTLRLPDGEKMKGVTGAGTRPLRSRAFMEFLRWVHYGPHRTRLAGRCSAGPYGVCPYT